MAWSSESIPIIACSFLVFYGCLRLMITCFKKGKQSPLRYWSRFVFRILFCIHTIVHLIEVIPAFSSLSASQYVSKGLLSVSLAFLAASLQDFICYSNRDPTFVKRNIIALTIPFEVILIESLILKDYANKKMDTDMIILAGIIFEVTLPTFIISLITIPALNALYEIKKNDFSKSLSTKNIIATCFFGLEIVFLVGFAFLEIGYVQKWFTTTREQFLLMKSSRDPIILMICLTQDMIDWMLRWLYLDEDAIDEDEDDHPDRASPIEIELVASDM